MLDRLGRLQGLQLRRLLDGVAAERGVHTQQPQHVEEAQRHLALATPQQSAPRPLPAIADQRMLLKVDDRLVQRLLLRREAAEQKMGGLGGKRGAENGGGGAAKNELLRDSGQLGVMRRPHEYFVRAHVGELALVLARVLPATGFDGPDEQLAEGGERGEDGGVDEDGESEEFLWANKQHRSTSISFWMGVPESSTRRVDGNCRRLSMVALPEEDLRRWPSSHTSSPALLALILSA